MEFKVYTFNAANNMFDTLTGIRHVLNYDEYSGLFVSIFAVVIVIGMIMAFRSKMPPLTFVTSAFMIPAALYAVIFTARVDVKIIDQYSSNFHAVDNIPLGLALPLTLCTTLEKILLDVIDTSIEVPGMPKFRDVGYFGDILGINYLRKDLIFSDANLMNTLTEYFDNCVYHSSTVPANMVSAPNMLAAINTNFTIFFSNIYTSSGKTLDTCQNVYNYLNSNISSQSVSTAPGSMLSQFASNFGEVGQQAGQAASILTSISSNAFTGYQTSSNQILSQSIVLAGLQNGLSTGGDSDLLSYVQGSNLMGTANSERNSLVSATLYVKHLPKLITFLKMLIIGAFPIVGCFFIANSGKPFIFWCGSLIWISCWLPLCALMHALYVPQVMDDLSLLNGGYNWLNQGQITKIIDDALYTAAILILTLPTLLGMILGWVAPRMVASALMVGRQLGGQRAGGDIKTSENFAKEKQEDQILSAFSATGDEWNNMSSSLNGRLGTGQHMMGAENLENKTPLDKQDIEQKRLSNARGSLGFGSAVNSSSLSNYNQQLSGAKATLNNAMDSYMETLANTRNSAHQAQSIASMMNNEGFQKAAQKLDTHSEAYRIAESHGEKYGLSAEQKSALASALATSAHIGFKMTAGTEVPFVFSAKGEMGTKIEGKIGTKHEESEKISSTAENSLADEYNKTFGFQSSDSEQTTTGHSSSAGTNISDSDSYATKDELSNSENFVRSASENYTELESLTQTETSLVNKGASTSIDGTRLVSDMDQNTLAALQVALASDDSISANNFKNADPYDEHDLETALWDDLHDGQLTDEGRENNVKLLNKISQISEANGQHDVARKAEIAALYEQDIAQRQDLLDNNAKLAGFKPKDTVDTLNGASQKIEEGQELLQENKEKLTATTPSRDNAQNVKKDDFSVPEVPEVPEDVKTALKTAEEPSPAEQITTEAAGEKSYNMPLFAVQASQQADNQSGYSYMPKSLSGEIDSGSPDPKEVPDETKDDRSRIRKMYDDSISGHEDRKQEIKDQDVLNAEHGASFNAGHVLSNTGSYMKNSFTGMIDDKTRHDMMNIPKPQSNTDSSTPTPAPTPGMPGSGQSSSGGQDRSSTPASSDQGAERGPEPGQEARNESYSPAPTPGMPGSVQSSSGGQDRSSASASSERGAERGPEPGQEARNESYSPAPTPGMPGSVQSSSGGQDRSSASASSERGAERGPEPGQEARNESYSPAPTPGMPGSGQSSSGGGDRSSAPASSERGVERGPEPGQEARNESSTPTPAPTPGMPGSGQSSSGGQDRSSTPASSDQGAERGPEPGQEARNESYSPAPTPGMPGSVQSSSGGQDRSSASASSERGAERGPEPGQEARNESYSPAPTPGMPGSVQSSSGGQDRSSASASSERGAERGPEPGQEARNESYSPAPTPGMPGSGQSSSGGQDRSSAPASSERGADNDQAKNEPSDSKSQPATEMDAQLKSSTQKMAVSVAEQTARKVAKSEVKDIIDDEVKKAAKNVSVSEAQKIVNSTQTLQKSSPTMSGSLSGSVSNTSVSTGSLSAGVNTGVPSSENSNQNTETVTVDREVERQDDQSLKTGSGGSLVSGNYRQNSNSQTSDPVDQYIRSQAKDSSNEKTSTDKNEEPSDENIENDISFVKPSSVRY
jgi:hypothetical protein